MAYKNVILGNIYTIIRPDLFTNRNYESPNSSLSDISPQPGFDYHQKSQTVFDDGNFKIRSSFSNNFLTINFYHNNNSVGYVSFNDDTNFDYIYFGFGIDAQANQKVSVVRVLSFTYNGRLYVKSYTDGDGDVPMISTIDINGLYNALKDYPTYPWEISNGGGATHIAKRTGQLKDLSSYTSDILIVSGGGGGGLLVGETDYSGKEAGGISGSGDNSADQTTGNAFGLGESGTNVSGGGSGLYGGYKGTSSKSGGAGSGYIGNSLLSNKKMVGYNVPTSSAENTKTESVNEVSAGAVSGKPKSGNGFAKIKFLRDWEGDEEMNYSKSEHLVGTWVDGSNLYEKTFEFLNQSLLQTGQAYDTDLSNIKCVYLHGFIKEGDNTYPLVWGSSAGFGIYYDSSTNKIRTKANDSFRNSDMYITIRYVKL